MLLHIEGPEKPQVHVVSSSQWKLPLYGLGSRALKGSLLAPNYSDRAPKVLALNFFSHNIAMFIVQSGTTDHLELQAMFQLT